jgi:hypothetical protein
MVNFKKYGVVAAAILCASATGMIDQSPGKEFLAYAYCVDEDEYVELEGAEAGLEWDPHACIALARHEALPVGSFAEVEYVDDEGRRKAVNVLIVGLCPEGLKSCVIMLSYAAARRINIDRAKEPVRVRVRVVRSKFISPLVEGKG